MLYIGEQGELFLSAAFKEMSIALVLNKNVPAS